MQGWLTHLWYETVAWVSAATSLLTWSLRVEGSHHVPRHGPVLLLANHQCYLDPVFIGSVTRRHLCYLARKNLWRTPAISKLLYSLNGVPVDQEGVAKEGLKMILEQLKLGKAVLVFPEGMRTWDGQMNPFKPGILLLIKRFQPPIIPIGIAGAYDAWPRWRAYPTPAPLFLPPTKCTVAVAFGKPIDSRRFAELPRDVALGELTMEIQKMWQRAEQLRRK